MLFDGKGTVNKVILIGRLGGDPELRYTPGGAAVATFSLATNVVWKDKDGNQQEKTDWHRVVAWRKLAEVCGEWLKKGSQVYVEGRLQTRSWEGKDGTKRYITEIIAGNLQMLGRKAEAGAEPFIPPPVSEIPEVGEPEAESPEVEEDLPF